MSVPFELKKDRTRTVYFSRFYTYCENGGAHLFSVLFFDLSFEFHWHCCSYVCHCVSISAPPSPLFSCEKKLAKKLFLPTNKPQYSANHPHPATLSMIIHPHRMHLPALSGLTGSARLADVGGVPNLVPLVTRSKVSDPSLSPRLASQTATSLRLSPTHVFLFLGRCTTFATWPNRLSCQARSSSALALAPAVLPASTARCGAAVALFVLPACLSAWTHTSL